MSEAHDWPATGEAAEAMQAYLGPPEPQPPTDLTSATLAAAERLAQRTLAETTCSVARIPIVLEGVTILVMWRRKEPEPPLFDIWPFNRNQHGARHAKPQQTDR